MILLMMKRVLLIGLLFLSNWSAEGQLFPRHPTGEPTATPLCEGAIACTLEQVQLGPVEFCIEVPMRNSSDVIGLCVWDFICNQLTFASLESSFMAPHSLPVGLDDLGLDCLGEWNVTESSEGSNETKHLYEGAFSLDMVDLTVRTEMEFTHYNTIYHQPEVLLFHNCSVPQAMFEVHFLGGALGKTLDVTLAPKIEDGLEDHADELLCDVLGTALTLGLSSKILDENLHREKTIDAGKKDYPPPVINGTYDWRTSRLASLHRLLDSVQSEASLLQCFLNSSTNFSTADENDIFFNKLINAMTNGTGELVIPINSIIYLGNTNSTLEIRSIVLSGLDTFTNVSLFVPSVESGAVLTSVIGLKELKLQVNIVLNATAAADAGSPNYYSEELVATLDTSNALLDVDLVVAISESKLTTIYVDQYLNNSDCIYAALEDLYVSSLDLELDIEEISLMQVDGDATALEHDVIVFVDNAFQWILSSWPIHDLLAGLGQTTIKTTVNANLQQYLGDRQQSANQHCPEHEEVSGPEYIHWNSSEAVQHLNTLVNMVIGVDGMNGLMNCLSGGTGQLTIVNNDTNTSITFSGLNTFYEFSLLYPAPGQPYSLDTAIAIGYCNSSSICTPFGIKLEGQIADRGIYMELAMENLELFIDLLFVIDSAIIENLNLKEAQTTSCVMSATKSLEIQSSSLAISAARLYLNDGNDDAINITEAVDYLISYYEDKGGLVSKINAELDYLTSTAADRCAGTYDPNAHEDDSADSIYATPADWSWQVSALVICVIVVAVCFHRFQYSGSTKPDDPLEERLIKPTNTDDNDVTLSKYLGVCFLKKLGYHDSEYDALFACSKVPSWLQFSFPLAVVACMIIVTASNMMVVASVMVEVHAWDETIKPGSLLDFSLGQTVHDMWHAGAYLLAVLISIFSGTWPYVKLLTMFVTWFAPSSAISRPWRGWALQWLDALGKWSLLDCYIMVMMMVAFSVEIYLTPGISAVATVVPRAGFNLFLLAILINLALGHIAAYCHRLDIEDVEVSKFPRRVEPALKEHCFHWLVPQRSHEKSENHSSWTYQRVQYTKFGSAAVALLLIGSMFLVIAGVYLLTYVYHFKGLVGYLLGEDADSKYSLITTGTTVPDASGKPNSFIVRWIQACFFGFGFVMPLLFLVLTLTLWMTPLSLTRFRQLVVLAEVANAWSAIDVFVVSVVAALFEIEEFAAFIIGDVCDDLNKILEEYFDDQLDGDDKCFDVTAELLGKFWVLALASCVVFFYGLFVLRMAQMALADRMGISKATKQPLQSSSFSYTQRIWAHAAEAGLAFRVFEKVD